ncbi:hypothetical protein J4459_01920 [Candidatus Woesearchaeota archaeon]|nr:hypothetical protein [Candidatus Woesearchaeota archaeon]
MISDVQISIILGFCCIFLFLFKKRRIPSLDTLVILFLNGSLFYGAFISLYLGLTGNFINSNNLEDYRLWITVGGLVLLYLAYKLLLQEINNKES